MEYDMYDDRKGSRKVGRLFGKRRNNGVSELFVLGTEMSDTKFVTTRARRRRLTGQG